MCPWHGECRGHAAGIAADLPRRAAKAPRPVRYGAHFWLEDAAEVLLRRRPPSGLLGGMLELPGTGWRAAPWTEAEALSHAPQRAAWRLAGRARHGFTHFELLIDVYAARVAVIAAPGLRRNRGELGEEALPSVMRKCVGVAENSGAVFTSR